MKPFADLTRELAAGVVDIVYPPKCLTCDALAEPFCDVCIEQIEPFVDSVPIPEGCEDARCVGLHTGPLRDAVLALKFSRKTALAEPLAWLLMNEMRRRPAWPGESLGVLVPVPVHWTRRLERGFNQAELLSVALGNASGIPVWDGLIRTRRTPPQVGRNRAERVEALRGLFAVRSNAPDLAGRSVILIDDVHTTGATLAEGARALRAAGAAEVRALTLTCEL